MFNHGARPGASPPGNAGVLKGWHPMYEKRKKGREGARDPVAIVTAMEGLMGELKEAITAGGRVQPAGTAQTLSECAQEPLIAGRPLSQFSNRPYIHVAKRRILDGEGGREVPVRNKKDFFPGATAALLAYMCEHPRIDEMDVISLHIQKSQGTVATRRRNARTTISRSNRSTKGMGLSITKLGDHRRSSEYMLCRPQDCPVLFSVEIAMQSARQAQANLEERRFDLATTAALEAIAVDEEVQLAHEVLCDASLMIGPDAFAHVHELQKSVQRIQDRVTRLGLCIDLIDRWLRQLHGEDRAKELKLVRARMQKEADRLGVMIGDVSTCFGALLDDAPPADMAANSLLVALRTRNLAVNQALNCPDGQKLLANNRIEGLHERARGRMPKNSTPGDRAQLARMVNTVVMQKALNPDTKADIRSVCTAAEYEIKRLQGCCSMRSSAESRIAKQIADAEALFQGINGRPAGIEELAQAVGLSVARIKEIQSWEALRRPPGGDAIERRCSKQDRDPDEDDDASPCRNGLTKHSYDDE
jgi:hypothetical protein